MDETEMSMSLGGHRIPLNIQLCPRCDGAGCSQCGDGFVFALPIGAQRERLSHAQRAALLLDS